MRLAVTLVLLGLLISAATCEQFFIRNTYGKLENDLTAFHETVLKQAERKENIDTKANKDKIERIYDFWVGKEKHLAHFTRYADLSLVSDALIYTMNFTRFDNAEETCAGIERAKYLIQAHTYNITSIRNVL